MDADRIGVWELSPGQAPHAEGSRPHSEHFQGDRHLLQYAELLIELEQSS